MTGEARCIGAIVVLSVAVGRVSHLGEPSVRRHLSPPSLILSKNKKEEKKHVQDLALVSMCQSVC